MSVQDEIAPVLMPGWKVYATARELRDMAELALELSMTGQRQDLPRARATLDRMRAVLGVGSASA